MESSGHVHNDMTSEVKNRLAKAAAEIEAKYASGMGGQDTSVTGPTGAAYAEKRAAELAKKKAKKALEEESLHQAAEAMDPTNEEEGQDDEYEIRTLREARLREIRNAHQEKVENIGKGHGQYREVVQDEFLKEVTSSLRVICHFYHRDFSRCTIMDHHLQALAARHIEAKFIKINADKAPFFVDKLAIRTIPTLVLFFDGVAKEKVLGFEGLSEVMPEGKEDEWPTVALARLLARKGILNDDAIVDEQQVEADRTAKFEEMRRRVIKETVISLEDEEDDFAL